LHVNQKHRKNIVRFVSGILVLLLLASGFRFLSLPINHSNQASFRYFRQSNAYHAQSAMVVSAQKLASETGLNIIRQGGNAIDAAVAVDFVLSVIYPSAGNIGGGGFMIIRIHDGQSYSLDFREKAPALATRNMYLDSSQNVIKRKSLDGILACGVPGSVMGMFEAHKRFGKLSWSRLLQPAIDLAENGFAISKTEARKLNRSASLFKQLNDPKPTFLLSENGWHEGDIFINKAMAQTLKLIRDHQSDGFYKGSTAQKIVEVMNRYGGLISKDDLENYRALWRPVIKGPYHHLNIISMGPPSSGGILLVQILTLLQDYPLNQWQWNSARAVQLITEIERRVYADRSEYLGDPDYYKVPVETLLDPAYLHKRMSNYQADRATASSAVGAGTIALSEKEETTHFSIIDDEGNAVAVTTTLNGSYGSKVVVAGAGFLLNNEMDDFSIKPGYPNAYGLVGSEANAIEPGKRMLSSMTPTIVEKDGALWMVIGTPGGSTIITAVLQTIINVADFGMNMQQSVSALKFHHQWKPDTIYTERGALLAVDSLALAGMGYHLLNRSPIGKLDGILVLPSGKLEAGADPRGEDFAIGF